MQSRRESIIEVCVNTGTAFLISLLVAELIFPIIFADGVSSGKNFLSVSIFTVVSIVRSYIWRRYFNLRLMRMVQGLNHSTSNVGAERSDQQEYECSPTDTESGRRERSDDIRPVMSS
jgi:hypothetical protein